MEKVHFSFQPWKAEYSLGAAFLLKVEIARGEFGIFLVNLCPTSFFY